MLVKTIYGNMEYDELQRSDIPKATLAFIKEQKETADLFFQEEIDLTHLPVEFQEHIQNIKKFIIAENKFENPAKAFALSEYLGGASFDDITESHGTFTAEGNDYHVLTDNEATKEALSRARDIVDDQGLELFEEDMLDFVIENFVKPKYFDEMLDLSDRLYAEDIQTETDGDDRYVNRLHEEMVEEGIMEEPEYPEEPNEDDYASPEEYDEAYEQWEKEVAEFKTDLELEVKNHIGAFVKHKKNNRGYDNSVQYWIATMGMEDTIENVKKEKLLDSDAIAKWVIAQDGRGTQLSTYDGEEHEYTVKYKGKEHEFFIYRSG